MALVTEGSGAIGSVITTVLARDGIHVAAGYSESEEAAEELAAKLRAEGVSVSVHQAPVLNPEACQRAVEDVLGQCGRIDYLVNSAGVIVDDGARSMTIDAWLEGLNVSFSGALHMSTAVLHHMLGRGSGRIVNITSVISEAGAIGHASYAASQRLFRLTKSLALETAGRATVNCIAPVWLETDMAAGISQQVSNSVTTDIRVGSVGRAWQIARTVRFLIDDGNGHITGAVLSANAGIVM